MIAIICAMDKERQSFIDALTNKNEQLIMGYSFMTGQINGHDTVLVKCGIGKVQAGVVTMLLIEHFHPEVVINSGVAGGFDQSLQELDLVCATKVSAYDVDFTAEGLPLGSLNGEDRFVENDITLKETNGFSLKYGLILSADIFATDRKHLEEIIDKYYQDEEVVAIDMESATIARICSEQNTKWCVIRAISDVIGGTKQVFNYEKFASQAASLSFQLIYQNYFQ